MKTFRLLPLLLMFTATAADAQERLRDLFIAMPDSVLPLLTKVNREDCIDFVEAGMEARVTNRLDGTTTLDTLAADYLRLSYTAASTVECCLLPMADSTSVICLHHCVLLPEADSHLRFFSTAWQPLPSSPQLLAHPRLKALQIRTALLKPKEVVEE